MSSTTEGPSYFPNSQGLNINQATVGGNSFTQYNPMMISQNTYHPGATHNSTVNNTRNTTYNSDTTRASSRRPPRVSRRWSDSEDSDDNDDVSPAPSKGYSRSNDHGSRNHVNPAYNAAPSNNPIWNGASHDARNDAGRFPNTPPSTGSPAQSNGYEGSNYHGPQNYGNPAYVPTPNDATWNGPSHDARNNAGHSPNMPPSRGSPAQSNGYEGSNVEAQNYGNPASVPPSNNATWNAASNDARNDAGRFPNVPPSTGPQEQQPQAAFPAHTQPLAHAQPPAPPQEAVPPPAAGAVASQDQSTPPAPEPYTSPIAADQASPIEKQEAKDQMLVAAPTQIKTTLPDSAPKQRKAKRASRAATSKESAAAAQIKSTLPDSAPKQPKAKRASRAATSKESAAAGEDQAEPKSKPDSKKKKPSFAKRLSSLFSRMTKNDASPK